MSLRSYCVWVLVLAACDELEPPAATAPSAVSSSTPPTPERIAGVEDGAVRLCIVPKGETGTTLTTEFSPALMKPEDLLPGEFAQVVLQKTDKGFCEYIRPNFSRLWGTFLEVKRPVGWEPGTEVGIYFLKDLKENPGADAMTYVKAVLNADNGYYEVFVRVVPVDVPRIEIQVHR